MKMKNEIRRRIELVMIQFAKGMPGATEKHLVSSSQERVPLEPYILPADSGSSFRRRFIAFGLRHKDSIKKIPLLNRVARRVYRHLAWSPVPQNSSLSVRIKRFIRRIPLLGFLAWWIYTTAKAPSKIVELSAEMAGLREEVQDLGVQLSKETEAACNKAVRETLTAIVELSAEMAGLREEVQDLGVQLSKETEAACNKAVRETLTAADSYTGPKAKAGLWFNEPILVRYDDVGHPLWTGTTERIIEKSWVLRHLADIPLGSRILDIGCSESTLSIELASNGFQVTGMDIRTYPLQHPNFRFVKADICSSQLESESYDVVTALSTIEHVGLGWYGVPQSGSLDYVAMKEIYRLLKPGGQLLMTVPFGQRSQTPLHRIYDSESLHALVYCVSFRIEKICYGIRIDDKTWISPVTEEKASQQRHDPTSGAPSAIAMVLCRKL